MSLTDTLPEGVVLPLPEEPAREKRKGFNTFFGVYLPSVLSIFGVILFLRMGYIVGNIGILQTSFIIFISSLITFITGLSISATATNMNVKSGGAYFMISRSFGIEIGGAIGIALFVAQVLSLVFYIEGFSEGVRYIFPYVNDIVLETSSLFAITALAYYSADIALKTQLFTFIIICFSILSFFIGKEVNLTETGPIAIPLTLGFWGAFALFFPAVTGIEAGFSMSGELKNPKKSLSVGTLSAVCTGFFVYLAVAFLLWKRVPGDLLRGDQMIMLNISKLEVLIMLGIWGATLSSAVGGIMGAPRTLQALAKDRIVPGFLGKGFGLNEEPRIATILTFIIAIVALYLGNINILAPILTMFFLISYGSLNLAAGLESLFGNPSWRPTFSVPATISLLGSFFCLIAMLMINVSATLIAIFSIVLLYILAKRKKLGKGWEDINQGALLFFCRFAIYRLANLKPSARCWRPYFLVFSRNPTQKPEVIDFANSITKSKGFLTIASILSTDKIQHEKVEHLEKLTRDSLAKLKIQCLMEIDKSDDFIAGMKKVITNYGLGPIHPNTILLGHSTKEPLYEKIAPVIKLVKDLGKNLIILKDDGQTLNGPIDIWWDEDYKENNELMIVIAHMLNDTARWKKSRVLLRCLVTHEHGREQRMAYFKDFFALSRLEVDVKVLVVPDKDAAPLKTISMFSSDASIIFMGLKPPSEEDGLDNYVCYLKDLMKNTKSLKRVVFFMGSEKIDLTKIFEYPI